MGRLLVGLGTSVIFISVLKAQSIWFNKREFTKASGLLSFIGNMGGDTCYISACYFSGLYGVALFNDWNGSALCPHLSD